MERFADVQPKGNYFVEPKANIEFFSSGCTLLNCALGGGWPLGRISNVVGDRATAKTLIAIEACANFAQSFPTGLIFYREAEAAFDEMYAEALGMPIDRVDFGDEQFITVEDLFEDLEKVLSKLKDNVPALYIIDSLDALSDREELGREIDKGSYGAAKAKLMSQLFRRLVKKANEKRMHIQFVSQVRDNLNAGLFGRKTTRSGGRALDFYASQIVYLSRLATVEHQSKGIKRATGIRVRAFVDKCKVGFPYRECEFEVVFGWGIDDLDASINFVDEAKRWSEFQVEDKKEFQKKLTKLSKEELVQATVGFQTKVIEIWQGIDRGFLREGRKYN